jgi:hypothetical protein
MRWIVFFVITLLLIIVKSGLRIACDGALICTRQYPEPSQYSTFSIIALALAVSVLAATTVTIFTAANGHKK